jgi:hypothetical protein
VPGCKSGSLAVPPNGTFWWLPSPSYVRAAAVEGFDITPST